MLPQGENSLEPTPFPDRRRGAVKRKRETPASRAAANKSTNRTPNAFSRRTPPRSDPSPRYSEDEDRSRSRSRSPPRKLKRPGAGARITREQRDAAEKARQERIEREKADIAQKAAAATGAEFVASHYNAVPERGREWRKTDSQIKGLRSLNNWIKSTLIQKFSRPEIPVQHLTVLDMACGKGGDLGKWEKAPQVPSLYVGCDIADISIDQAKDRYAESQRKRGRFRRGPQMDAQFHVHDAFKDSFVDIPIVRQVGFNPLIRQAGKAELGMGYGGFDVVSMMFALHYSFENEELVKGMLANVAGALKKGGHFIGVMPNANVISGELKKQLSGGDNMTGRTPAVTVATPAKVSQENGDGNDEGDWDPEKPSEPVVNAVASTTQDGSDDDWDPEKPSEPVMTSTTANDDGEDDDWDPEKPSEPAALASTDPNTSTEPSNQTPALNTSTSMTTTGEPITWGNKIYSITFPRKQPLTQRPLPSDGIFRPAFGWKYIYHLVEAVDAPEFVVPFEILRAMAVDFGLELRYVKPFREVLDIESEDRELGMLAERMGVKSRDRAFGGGTGLLVSEEELEAADFYIAFCFYRT